MGGKPSRPVQGPKWAAKPEQALCAHPVVERGAVRLMRHPDLPGRHGDGGAAIAGDRDVLGLHPHSLVGARTLQYPRNIRRRARGRKRPLCYPAA